jgi:hypothetical protein
MVNVYLETEPGVGIDWHLEHRLDLIGQHSWDSVVMHGFSTLDPKKPGDPTVLIATVKQMPESATSQAEILDHSLRRARHQSAWPVTSHDH